MDDPEPDRLGPIEARQGTETLRGRRVVTYVGTAAGVAALAAVIVAASTMGGRSPGAGEPPRSPGFVADPSASPIAEEPVTPPSGTPEIATTEGETAPVVLDLPGWSCGAAGDEKMLCSSGIGTVVVTWRPAREHADWLSDPDKSAPYVGEVHGRWFITVAGAASIPDQLAITVGEALRWVP